MKTLRVPVLSILTLSVFIPSVSISEGLKPVARQTNTTWTATQRRLNINNISTEFRNDGWTDRYSSNGNSGCLFPVGTAKSLVFQSGLVWGTKIYDPPGDTIRVGGATYSVGLQPGRILSPGVPEDPNLPKNRIYRVRPDYATADLSVEAAEEGRTQTEIRAQYTMDWNQWPAGDGAPFYDRNNNGTYEPAIDIPGKIGADQTIWYVCNDLDTTRTRALYGTIPLGLEMQTTIWGYNRSGSLNGTILKQYRLINKSSRTFDSMFVCQWVDSDLGDASDDFAGCDTTLHLAYCYNGSPIDALYAPFPPPAVGYQLLGLTMTASFAFVSGSSIADPPFTHDGARQWYNLLQGLIPFSGAPFIHPSVPGPTRFWYDGDPISGAGRLDGIMSGPGDRRIGACSGPFIMLPNQSKDIVIAQTASMGSSRLSSVTKLKEHTRNIRGMISGLLASAPPKFEAHVTIISATQATVQLVADGRPTRTQSMTARILRQDGSLVTVIVLFDDGLHGDGGANDGIWGNAATMNREASGFYVNAAIVDSLARSFTWDRIYDNLSTAGPLRLINPAVFSDNINNDGQVNPRENVRYGFTVLNAGTFPHGGILLSPSFETEIKVIRLSGVPGGGSINLNYNPNDSLSYFTFTAPDSGVKVIPFTIVDSSSNSWRDTVRFTVIPFSQPIYGTPVNHVAGNSEWMFNTLVVNPAIINNHPYRITIVDSIDSARTKGFTLRDLVTGTNLLVAHTFPDQFGHNIPVTAGFKVFRGATFEVAGLRRDSTRWISPNPVWLRGNRFTFDPHAAFNGGATTGAMLPNYLGAVQSNFDADRSIPVEVRFSTSNPQKAYRLRRTGSSSSYYIQSPNPFVDVPFSVWDVSNRSNPRQLTLAWRDQNNDTIWDPSTTDDGVEIVFVYFKTYDPTGTTQFSMPPNAIPNECTIGVNADIVYGLSLAVVNGHVLNESPGTLYLYPHYPLTSNDIFTFNPTVMLGVGQNELPTSFELLQNYPNPFNPSTTIQYELPAMSRVTIRLYNIVGQQVRTLVDGIQDAGFKSVQWNGTNDLGNVAASGVYFYRITANAAGNGMKSFTQVKKMLLLR